MFLLLLSRYSSTHILPFTLRFPQFIICLLFNPVLVVFFFGMSFPCYLSSPSSHFPPIFYLLFFPRLLQFLIPLLYNLILLLMPYVYLLIFLPLPLRHPSNQSSFFSCHTSFHPSRLFHTCLALSSFLTPLVSLISLPITVTLAAAQIGRALAVGPTWHWYSPSSSNVMPLMMR